MSLHSRPLPRLFGALPIAVVALTVGATPMLAAPAQPAVRAIAAAPTADTAAWLGQQVLASSGPLDSGYGPDLGLTIDAVIGLAASGTGADAVTKAIGFVKDFGQAYIGAPNDLTKSAAVAKAVVALQIADPAGAIDGRDVTTLLGELTAQANGDGSYGDMKAQYPSDTPYSHAYIVAAFERAGQSDAATKALAFYDAWQCTGGGYGWDQPCAGGADVDVTAMAIIGRLTGGQTATATPRLAADIAWLRNQQDPAGGFATFGAVNANSTGVAGWALSLAGEQDVPAQAASYIGSLTLGCAKPGVDPAQIGAVAPDAGALDKPVDAAWTRATAQAVLVNSTAGLLTLSAGNLTPTAAIASCSARAADAPALASTGLDQRLLVALVLGLAFVVAGAGLLTLRRRPSERR